MGPCQSTRKGKSLRGVCVYLESESELEIANNNQPLTTKRRYTSLVRSRSLDQCSNYSTATEEVLRGVFGDVNGNTFKKPRIDAVGDHKIEDRCEDEEDVNGNTFKKPRIDAGGAGEHKPEDHCEDDDRGSQEFEVEESEIFFDAVEDFNDDGTGDSEDEDVDLADYPHINNFPDLEDIDVAEDTEAEEEPVQDQGQTQEDPHNTSNTAPDPEFSDHQWSQSQRTSELDLIVYSDRTSSEFFPDPRAFVRNEPMPTIWDIET